MRVKVKSEKPGLKLNIQKKLKSWNLVLSSRQINEEKVKEVTDFISLGSKISVDGDCSHEIKRCLILERKDMINLVKVTQACPTLCNPMDHSTPGFPVHHQLSELAQTHIHWVGDAIQPSHPVLSSSPPAFNLSQHLRVFSNESALHIRWPKYWSFSFSISPLNEYSGFIFFRMDWLDLLSVQGTLKSLLQHHSSKASILPCSAFFMVQLSHPYMTGKTIALTR